MTRYTIGIDNGATGTIGIFGPHGEIFESVPTQDCLHYGKAGTISQRLDREALKTLLRGICVGQGMMARVRCYIERPFTGSPMMIKSMLSAHRFFEATICTLEDLGIGYEVVDSGEWQAAILGNVKGSAALKKASMLRGCQLFPQHKTAIEAHGDADGLLMAYFFHERTGQRLRKLTAIGDRIAAGLYIPGVDDCPSTNDEPTQSPPTRP